MTARRLAPLLILAAACGAAPEEPDAPAAAGGDTQAVADTTPEVPGFTADEVRAFLRLSPLPPPPPDPTNRVYEDARAARFGQYLFFDTRFSASGTVACATCHEPGATWADTRTLAEGEGEVARHTMTLWNAAYQRWMFWDGRADSLWAQALQPFEEEAEHGVSRLRVLHEVAADGDLRRAYEELFGALPPLEDATRFPEEARPVPGDAGHPHARAWATMASEDQGLVDAAYANLGKSIAAFERLLVSREAPFDRFVEGVREGDLIKQRDLGAAGRRGLSLFLGKARCILCHSGPNFSDREFHDNRVAPLHGGKRRDAGRYEGVTLVEENPFNGVGVHSDDPDGAARDKVGYLIRAGHNWSEFRTPGLRNVALTAPYMHQGQLEDLDAVIAHYDTLEGAVRNHHQGEKTLVPLGLTSEERADLHEFLLALTDARLDPELLTKPATPWMP